MAANKILPPNVLTDYTWVGLSGEKYHPMICAGKWYFVNSEDYLLYGREFSFEEVVYLSKIPEDDRLFIVLKYGVCRNTAWPTV